MRLRICQLCKSVFTPFVNESICPECSIIKRTAKPFLCEIEESPGRFEGYFKGICEACLEYCAAYDWQGWRAKNGCEWWKQTRYNTSLRSNQTTTPG